MKFAVFIGLSCGLVLSGCASKQPFPKSGFAANFANRASFKKTPFGNSLIGSLETGPVSGEYGSVLSRGEKDKALKAEYVALENTPANQKVEWRGDGANGGVVQPGQPYRVGSQNCRRYSHTFINNGGKHRDWATACRNDDGSWTPLT